jgi:hypothetical protein
VTRSCGPDSVLSDSKKGDFLSQPRAFLLHSATSSGLERLSACDTHPLQSQKRSCSGDVDLF